MPLLLLLIAAQDDDRLNPARGRLQVVAIDLARVLADSANDHMQSAASYEQVFGTIPLEIGGGGELAIDATEKFAYVRMERAAAAKLLAPDTKIEPNFGSRNLGAGPSGVAQMNLETGAVTPVVAVPFQVGHIQSNPWVPGEVVFCWETGGKAPQRTWTVLADGTRIQFQSAMLATDHRSLNICIVPVPRAWLERKYEDNLAWGMSSGSFGTSHMSAQSRTNPAPPRDAQPSRPSRSALKVPGQWEYSAPLIAPEARASNPSRAQKDPTVVFYQGKWHVFMTVKLPGKSAIEYGAFTRWEDANAAQRTILPLSDSDYYCAPQVFYFRPRQKWYLVYQVGMPGLNKMWVAYSTTTNLADPNRWTRAVPMLDGGPNDPRPVGGLDYWIICDDQRAYLFFTSLDGKMWRLWTSLAEFPQGFAHAELALEAKIFEASHTYKLKGRNQYLTVIEENGRRYYKAYVADRLDGKWIPVADTAERPFAGWNNIRPAAGVEAWTDNVSHGELLRDGYDETLTVDPAKLQFLFQGMWEKHKSGKEYGQFQWRIGLLTPVAEERK